MKKILLAILACFTFTISQAQIFVVQTSSGQQNGTSWADAYTDLSTAIFEASSGDTIWVAEGIYKPLVGALNNVCLDGLAGSDCHTHLGRHFVGGPMECDKSVVFIDDDTLNFCQGLNN